MLSLPFGLPLFISNGLLGSSYLLLLSLYLVINPPWVEDSVVTLASTGHGFSCASIYEAPLMFYDIVTNKALIFTLLANLSGVYMFLNRVNGKTYIGSAVNLAQRFRHHLYGTSSNINLQRAFKKYGQVNFSFIVLDICTATKDVLLSLEQLALDLWNQPIIFYG
jgi:hypothetical protein